MIIEEAVLEKVKVLESQQAANCDNVFGIEYLQLDRAKVMARMPVTAATKQPFGFLHGGASVYLAETVASVGAWLNLVDEKQGVRGVEINANHLRSVRDGWVTATAEPIHRGKTTHVWQINVQNESGVLVAVCRCTLMIV